MSIRIIDGVPWVGERSFPWASGVDHADRTLGGGGFVETFHERRFRLTFENGWTLSVVFGTSTYSDNRWGYEPFSEEVEEVEIGAWLRRGELVPWTNGDTVHGWVTEPQLLALIDEMMTWPSSVPDCFVASLPSER